MRQVLFILFIVCAAHIANAQPAQRRAEQQRAQTKTNANNLTTRAQISFPTETNMSEDVVWRRDVYRQLNLIDDANAGLYYPVEPVGSQMNLFTYMFKLMMTGQLRAYEYRLDGNETFEDSARIKPLEFLDNYHIYYERTDRGVHLDNSDIPSGEVKAYYVKESTYFDQSTGTFHTKIVALCPIMEREDDFGSGASTYPLFWVKYDDLAPFLNKQTIMTSNLNNAATMSMNDFFTMNMYKGKIYKTTNMLGKTLAEYYPNDSLLSNEQKRIENEIKTFEKNMWGAHENTDSIDSIAQIGDVQKPAKVKKTTRRSSVTTAKPKNRRVSKSSSDSTPAARVSVRRERH